MQGLERYKYYKWKNDMSLSQVEKSHIDIEGHITIWDPESGEVIVKRRNAINFENMSIAIANLLANESGTTGPYQISSMKFGNGGTVIDGTGAVTYKATNTNTTTGALHNETFSQLVDENSNVVPAGNSVTVNHESGNLFSDVIVTCTLDYPTPVGQDPFDTSLDMNGDYVFDELAIYSANDDLLTHVIFHPVQKSANRKIQVIYTLRIRTSYGDV
jgi:hypothetical protein